MIAAQASATSDRILKCLDAEACPHDKWQERPARTTYGDGVCGDGYRGPLCAVCKHGYAPARARGCEACTGSYVGYSVAMCLLFVLALAGE